MSIITPRVASHPDAQGQDLHSGDKEDPGLSRASPESCKPYKDPNKLGPASGSGLILPPVQGVSPGNGVRVKEARTVCLQWAIVNTHCPLYQQSLVCGQAPLPERLANMPA